MKLLETMFSITPKALNAIDMMRTAHELTLSTVDSEVLGVAHVSQSVVAAPAVRVDHRFGRNATTNNGLQRSFFAIRHDLRVDIAISLQEAEDDGLTARSATALASHSSSAEVRLVNFDFAGRER